MKKTDNTATPIPGWLTNLINRYYECGLSDTEEQHLRNIIADTAYSHPEIDCIRAIMGIRKPSVAKKGLRAYTAVAVTAAASITAIIISATCIFNTSDPVDANVCYAYVNGACITDENAIINLITDNIRELNSEAKAAGQEVRSEMSYIASIIESESNFPEI